MLGRFAAVRLAVFAVIFLIFSFCFKGIVRPIFAIIAGLLVGLSRGAVVYDLYDYLANESGREVVIIGNISNYPTEKEEKIRFELSSERGDIFYVTTSNGVSLGYGDRVTVKGKISEGFGKYPIAI